MAEIDILNPKGKVVAKYGLDDKVFDGKISAALMHQAVVTYLANRRQGTAKAKTRAEVSGGGRKPWRQKGTGRARVGSSRSPLWKGGGVTFGPRPRDFRKDFPKRMRAMALKSALNAQLKEEALMVIDDIDLKQPKTREIVQISKKLKIDAQKIRLIVEAADQKLKQASGNLENFSVESADNLTTYTALDCSRIVFTRQSLEKVEGRIKKWLK